MKAISEGRIFKRSAFPLSLLFIGGLTIINPDGSISSVSGQLSIDDQQFYPLLIILSLSLSFIIATFFSTFSTTFLPKIRRKND